MEHNCTVFPQSMFLFWTKEYKEKETQSRFFKKHKAQIHIMNCVNAKGLHTFLLNLKKDYNTTKEKQKEAINDTNLILITLGFKN